MPNSFGCPISTSSSGLWSWPSPSPSPAPSWPSRSPTMPRAMPAGSGRPLFYLLVMLPLWSSYLVKVYAWKLILAKEGIISWLAEQTASHLAARRHPGDSGHRRAVPVDQLPRHLPRLLLRLAALHDPADPGGARTRAGQPDRGVRRSRRRAAPDVPDGDPAAGASRHHRRLDLHLLADARRLHHPADRRQLPPTSSARPSTPCREPPGTFRWPPPSPWFPSSSC